MDGRISNAKGARTHDKSLSSVLIPPRLLNDPISQRRGLLRKDGIV